MVSGIFLCTDQAILINYKVASMMKKTKSTEEKMFKTVLISEQLFKKIENRIKGTGFTSVSGYVTYVLEEILAESEEEESFTKEDEERIKERLRALGYIE